MPVGAQENDIAGEPTAVGATIVGDAVADDTATAVRNLQEAGAIVVAKTTMTEFAGTTRQGNFSRR